MNFLKVTEESLKLAAGVLRGGGLVAFPTETVYGLGADAFNANALVKIFEAKGRPRFDPLIIHIAAVETLNDVCNLSLLNKEKYEKLFLLTKHFWPGPLSLVLPKSEKIPGIATSGLSTAAVRFPSNETAQKLISLSGGAVAAPSANPFGMLSPTHAEHVRSGLGEKVDIILDGGPAQIGVESTVLDITGETVKILRHGGVPKEELEKLIGTVAINNEQELINNEQEGGLVSPGQLKSHYAPNTPLSVFNREDIPNLPQEENAAYLFFDNKSKDMFFLCVQTKNPLCPVRLKTLSTNGNLHEAASCLFETLHEMDKLGVKQIYAQLAPQEGLGAAINDRLIKAGNFRA